MPAQRKTQDDEYTVIYTAFITLRNGKRLFARNYGLKAFRIVVRKKR